MYTAHIISLILYLFIPIIAVVASKKVCDSLADHRVAKNTLLFFLGTATTFSFLFIGLQVDWIISNNNSVVGDTSAFLWLMFDYVNAVGYIISTTAVGVVADLFGVTLRKLKDCECRPVCNPAIGKNGIVCYDTEDLKKTDFKVDEVQKGIRIYVKEVEELTESLEKTSKALRDKVNKYRP